MADRLTPKENYLRLSRGEEIEYIPTHNMWSAPVYDEVPIKPFGAMNLLYCDDLKPGAATFHDYWGVEYTSVPAANGGYIPTGTHTGQYLIKDLYHWRDYINRPTQYDDIDWKIQAEKELRDFDRSRTAVVCGSPVMPFQQIMAMLGFNEGLIAMFEEPEIIREILDYMVSYLEPHLQANVEYYKPDLFYLLDDTATQMAPFISLEMFRDLIKPFYVRLLKPYTDRGIPVIYHNCGKCEALLPDMVELGVRYWEPAQPINDLHKIQQTLGEQYHFTVMGGFEWKEPDTWPEVSEEYVRAQMRANIDEYAPYGHFAVAAAVIGQLGDPVTAQVNAWLADESYHYRREWMKKNR